MTTFKREPNGAPSVSVIVPHYNDSHYLEGALKAMFAQPYRPIEVIIVDDGSDPEHRDRLLELVEEFQPVTVLELGKNRGINVAVNHGVKRATGRYVYLSGVDDRVTPDFFSRSVTILEQHPKACLSFCDVIIAEKEGNRHSYPLELSDQPVFFSPEQFRRLKSRNHFHISSCTVLFRRCSLVEVGCYIECLGWLSDYFAVNSIALRLGCCYVPEPMVEFLERKDGYSSRISRNWELRRTYLLNFAALVTSKENRSLRELFAEAGEFPDYSYSALYLCLSHRNLRGFLTPRLIVRFLFRGTWYELSSVLPKTFRMSVARGYRRIISKTTG